MTHHTLTPFRSSLLNLLRLVPILFLLVLTAQAQTSQTTTDKLTSGLGGTQHDGVDQYQEMASTRRA